MLYATKCDISYDSMMEILRNLKLEKGIRRTPQKMCSLLGEVYSLCQNRRMRKIKETKSRKVKGTKERQMVDRLVK